MWLCSVNFILQGINKQLKELEKAKDYYMKKNKEQAKTVKTFVSQIAGKPFVLINEYRYHLVSYQTDCFNLFKPEARCYIFSC